MSGVDGVPETPGARRWEFVKAFVEHGWVRPRAYRPVARPHVVLLMATLAAALALGAGAVMQWLRPVKLPDAAAPKPRTTGSFTSVAGWDCPGTARSGFDATGRQPSWSTVPDGGWREDGCHGTFEIIPMSGKADQEAPSQFAVWWFAPEAVARCEVQVYLPQAGRGHYRPASSAQFYVLAGRSGTAFAQFVVDLGSRPGSWLPVGTYPVNPGGIAVQMVDRGVPASPDTMLVVSQVKVACTS